MFLIFKSYKSLVSQVLVTYSGSFSPAKCFHILFSCCDQVWKPHNTYETRKGNKKLNNFLREILEHGLNLQSGRRNRVSKGCVPANSSGSVFKQKMEEQKVLMGVLRDSVWCSTAM